MSFISKIVLLISVWLDKAVCLGDIQHKGQIAIASQVEDRIVTSNVLATYQGIHIPANCLELCTKDNACLSFFYQPMEQLCYINTVVFLPFESFWTLRNGTVYYLRIFVGVCGSLDYIYHPVTNICYKYYPGMKFNQAAAIAHCLSEGGQLISLDTLDKFNHIQAFFKTIQDLEGNLQKIIVGAINENGKWRWVNGSPLPNTSAVWAPLYPSGGQSPFYGRLRTKYGFRLVIEYSDTNNRLICERIPN